jgi:hypothetical protein
MGRQRAWIGSRSQEVFLLAVSSVEATFMNVKRTKFGKALIIVSDTAFRIFESELASMRKY